MKVDIMAACDLVRILHESRVSGPGAVHEYGCPCTKLGKKFGPCACPAGPVERRLLAVLKRLGLACKRCGAYKARRRSGHYMACPASCGYVKGNAAKYRRAGA